MHVPRSPAGRPSRWRLARLAAALIVVLPTACADSAGQLAPRDARSAALGAAAVPFRATVTSTSVTRPGPECPVLGVFITGTGHATHLGRMTDAQYHCIDPFGAEPLRFTGGRFTFTAANGDAVVGTYQGALVPTAQPGVFAIDGQFTITGGTGRFAGATGGGSASGTTSLQTGEASLSLDGTISGMGGRP